MKRDFRIYKGNYESIIDVETFNKVSVLLKSRGKCQEENE